MRFFISSFIVIIVLFIAAVYAETNIYDGCYLCYQHSQFVTFKGKDTNEKREEALERFGCKVYATMPSCDPGNYPELIFIHHL